VPPLPVPPPQPLSLAVTRDGSEEVVVVGPLEGCPGVPAAGGGVGVVVGRLGRGRGVGLVG